jgi:hypothetical protein
MLQLIAMLFYIGGMVAFEQAGRSFWAIIFWPYHMGKKIGQFALTGEARHD